MLKEIKHKSLNSSLDKQLVLSVPDADYRLCLVNKIIEGFEKLADMTFDLGDEKIECIHISGRVINNKLIVRYLYTRSTLEVFLGKKELKYECNVNMDNVWFDVNGIRLSRKDIMKNESFKQKAKTS